ncbi:uncharacterized protein LOC123416178 [Hordeum vulgare subsp. vulgare]|uniref:Transcription repressor n=1 Tax=Hordeum vulgare subsp. vulgare TaxID=112509 RepID=A0A8I6WEB4_HORVV|nr:uncharacterized protein LOC123416178 [Hordeum vulgare subsp. vulgare]
MRWGSKKQQHGTSPCAPEQGGEAGERKGSAKSKAFSFSPLSWLAKLASNSKLRAATKVGSGTTPKHALVSTHEERAAPAFSSCLRERTTPAKVAIARVGRRSSPRRSPAATSQVVPRRLFVGNGNDNADAVAARGHHRSPVAVVATEEVVPRRLSVGNDNADADAVAARRHCRPRRHCSVGGDRDLQAPLGKHIPFSLAGSPAQPAPPPQTASAAAPSDTDGGGARQRRRHRGRRHRRSLSGGRRSSFSGKVTLRVKVRSPRRSAPELESLAVVRRTRDPQRAFRESMSEMIASSGGTDARPEELERLLACYLALNADEHHDCIVKVFRQVWFDHVNLPPPRRGREEHPGRHARP